MPRSIAALTLILGLCACLAWAGQASEAESAEPLQAVTRPVHAYRLAPPVDEVVREVLVRPGDVVEDGAPLVRLRDGEARLQVELLELRALSTLRIDAAEAAWQVSVLEEQENRAAMEAGAVLEPEMRRVELRTKRDRLVHQQAIQEQRDLELQLERARETLTRYTLRAPAPGIVVAVNVEAGELPGAGDPLVEIVDTSSLRVELGVPAARSMTIRSGDGAMVTLRMPGGQRAELEGRVVFVSPIVDIAAGAREDRGQRMVHVVAPNPEGYPAGTLASVRFPG